MIAHVTVRDLRRPLSGTCRASRRSGLAREHASPSCQVSRWQAQYARMVAMQGYAGTGKTTMLKRLRAVGQSRGFRAVGLAPSASAPKTLQAGFGIGSESLQRWPARHGGTAEGRGTAEGLKRLRAANRKTILMVDESSLASGAQVRDLLRIATTLRVPRVALVGDERQLGAVEAGKPFAQLKAAGMETAVMDDIVRQRDAELQAAVRASLQGDVKAAFARLGGNVRRAGDLAAETARLWLDLPAPRNRASGPGSSRRRVRSATGSTRPSAKASLPRARFPDRRWRRTG